MKFPTLLNAMLASYTLASPTIVNSPEANTLLTRSLSTESTPRVDVTLPAGPEKVQRELSDGMRRASKDHDSVLKFMDFIAARVRAECQDINTAVEAAKFEGLKSEAVVAAVHTMNNIRTLLSKTVSQLDTMSNMVFTQEERRNLIDDLHVVTSEFFKTTRGYIDTLGGATGGRSLSRAAHMLTDVLDNVVTIDTGVASDMSRKLIPVFSGVDGDDGKLLNVIVSPVTSFLSSIKLDKAPTAACSGSKDCFSNRGEELR
ncbi:hypothetical protein FSPOR_3290 [Fusarium sporotrichioides]|uniref:Uncharacterized protein n=1 Tax=Fusarium sporotrichioides TaxID=5514 RepID=A0A395SGI5_FUSSP|nr:hypothetical protein FSPOR_3290 [Fusarium sporotrichioides]